MSAMAAAMDDIVDDPDCPGLRVEDYCHLAEECILLAAVIKPPEAAAELMRAGDEYLRRAADWLADQLKNGQRCAATARSKDDAKGGAA
jgi:hypothetical protein